MMNNNYRNQSATKRWTDPSSGGKPVTRNQKKNTGRQIKSSSGYQFLVSGFSRRGFTLIELIISLIVISLALMTLVQTQGQILGLTTQPDRNIIGYHLAEQEFERISALPYTSIVDEAGATNYTGSFATYSHQNDVIDYTSTPHPVMGNGKQVDIIILRNSVEVARLTTFVTDY